MSIKRLLSKIGLFFTGLFNAAKKAWKNTSEDIQNAMLKGSGLVAVINEYAGQAPEVVWKVIQTKFPEITEARFKEILALVNKDLGLVNELNDPDLLGMLHKVLDKMKELKGDGSTWAKVSHGLYLTISLFESPKGTKVAILTSLAEFVYHTFVKKDK